MRFSMREVLFVLVLVAMPVAAYWFVFKPLNQQLAQAREEIQSKRNKLERLEQATRQFEDLGREIDKLTSTIAMFESKLPAEKEVEVILKQVWQLASSHGLKARSVRTEELIEANRYSELPIRMVITGNFDSFYAFLLDLERLSRITQVPAMTLEKLKKGTQGQMRATFTLSIFFEAQDTKRKWSI